MKLKVFGGNSFHNGKQERTIVAASSQKEVAQLTGNSLYYIAGWWSVTENEAEKKLAMSKPHQVIFTGKTF